MNNKKIKILYLDFDMAYLLKNRKYTIGGTAVEWYAWLKGFSAIGNDVGLLTWKGTKRYIERDVEFDLVESYNLEKGLPKVRFLTYQLPNLIKAIRKYKPDVLIQAGSNKFGAIAGLCSKFTKVPYVFRVVSDMDVDGRFVKHFPSYMSYFIKKSIQQASIISCQNEYQLQKVKEYYPKIKSYVHYNPFHFNEIEIKKRDDRNYIAWVGNFSFEKNIPELANIATKLSNYKFKIAGKGFEEPDPEVVSAMNKLNNLKNVEFVGYLKNENIPSFLISAICLLNTSRLEGFSNTFLEAWSVGTPVVTTQNVNPDNLVSDNQIGIVAKDYSDLDLKLTELLNLSENEFSVYSQRSISYVKKNHNPLKLAEQFVEDILPIINKV